MFIIDHNKHMLASTLTQKSIYTQTYTAFLHRHAHISLNIYAQITYIKTHTISTQCPHTERLFINYVTPKGRGGPGLMVIRCDIEEKRD